jgi:hypothetical protein
MTMELDLGPQYPRDAPFTARMRLHQSWYRASVLRAPCGTGPRPSSTSHYGNMLNSEDAARGLNFLTPAIFEAAQARLAQQVGVVERFRLLHNLLSSQPMCFNLFAPLADDLGLATRVFRVVLGDREVREVKTVQFEYAPEPRDGYLDDGTAFDAFITYARPDGAAGSAGIETKLTEPFSQKSYDSPAYRRWMEAPHAPWRSDAWAQVAEVRHNQLWRDHLLAIALRDHPTSNCASARFILVRHPLDRDCAETVAGYRRLLNADDSTFVDPPLDSLVDAVGESVRDERGRRWVAEFRLRYLDLRASEEAWRSR